MLALFNLLTKDIHSGHTKTVCMQPPWQIKNIIKFCTWSVVCQ